MNTPPSQSGFATPLYGARSENIPVQVHLWLFDSPTAILFFSLDVEEYLSNLRKEQENILSHMAFTSDIANVKVKFRKCVLRLVETFYKSTD